MAWPHILPRSDSSFLCPRTSCIYMHGNQICMHYIEGSIGLMSWSSNSEPIASNLSFYCFWLLIRRLLVSEVLQLDQVENTERALWKICLLKPQTATKVRAGQEASCVGRWACCRYIMVVQTPLLLSWLSLFLFLLYRRYISYRLLSSLKLFTFLK